MNIKSFKAKSDLYQQLLFAFTSVSGQDRDTLLKYHPLKKKFVENVKNECEGLGEWQDEWSGVSFKTDLDDLICSIIDLDMKVILIGSYMSENHIGGDDVIGYIDEVLTAISEGYPHIHTDYVDGTAYVIAFKE